MGTDDLHPAELAARIRFWRKRAALRSMDLAKRCGVSAASVSSWEHGRCAPTHENLAAVAAACGVSLGAFWDAPLVIVGGDDGKTRPGW